MAEIYRSDIVRVDLYHALLRKHVGAILVTGDKLGNRFGAEIFRDGNPVDVTGCGVTAYFMRPSEDAIVLNGTASGSVAYVDLAQACYSKASSFTLTIKISYGGATTALRVIDGYILLTQTDDLVDPGEVVPTLDDIFAQIAAMEAATAAAQEATKLAIAAKDNANGAAVNAVNIATEKGDQAIQLAQEEAGKQNVKIATLTEEIARNTAPPIIPTATGEVVTVSDSAPRPLAGLRLYGKTTQDGTPTPNSPVPLVHAGKSGRIGVYSRGKNIFDTSPTGAQCIGSYYVNTSYYDFLISEYENTYAYRVEVQGGKEYIVTTSASAWDTNVRFEDAERNLVDGSLDYPNLKNRMIAVPAQAAYMVVSIEKTDVTAHTYQIEVGGTATAYEPYKDGGSLTASTPNGLPGIPVSSGGNYTDSTGQQWICDEKDFERGVHVQRVGRRTFDGSQSVEDASTAGIGACYLMLYGSQETACPHMTTQTTVMQNYHDWHDSLAREGTYSCVNSQVMYIRIQGIDTPDGVKAHLTANPLEIVYALATPIETPIHADELAAYRAMTSQKPTTTVYNDAGAGLAVEYIADTKNYIDQKLAAIAAATI